MRCPVPTKQGFASEWPRSSPDCPTPKNVYLCRSFVCSLPQSLTCSIEESSWSVILTRSAPVSCSCRNRGTCSLSCRSASHRHTSSLLHDSITPRAARPAGPTTAGPPQRLLSTKKRQSDRARKRGGWHKHPAAHPPQGQCRPWPPAPPAPRHGKRRKRAARAHGRPIRPRAPPPHPGMARGAQHADHGPCSCAPAPSAPSPRPARRPSAHLLQLGGGRMCVGGLARSRLQASGEGSWQTGLSLRARRGPAAAAYEGRAAAASELGRHAQCLRDWTRPPDAVPAKVSNNIMIRRLDDDDDDADGGDDGDDDDDDD